jgi:hypothetical protein
VKFCDAGSVEGKQRLKGEEERRKKRKGYDVGYLCYK